MISKMISAKIANRLIFLLSLLGLVIVAYLYYEYSLSSSINCPLTGPGCDIVRASQYSYFLGIRIPFWGIAYYMIMGFLSLARSSNLKNSIIGRIQLLGALSGAGFGVYLTAVEAFVIHAFCSWCLASFAVTIALLAVKIMEKKYEL